MSNYAVGQRWVSNTEADLGLGVILQAEGRRVVIAFDAAEEERMYTIESAPLSRIILAEGETITDKQDQPHTVEEVLEHNNLKFYRTTNDDIICETELSPRIKQKTAETRLLSGNINSAKWFNHRLSTWKHLSNWWQNDNKGLLGNRAELIPHQLYIAKSVSDRLTPRVMLADEVGLGKTIEAGMVINRLILQGRVNKLLILVPLNLTHQWLVELIRRFNIMPCLFNDPETPEIIDEENIILMPINLLHDEQVFAKVRDNDWDMMVIDEAHHIEWSPANPSPLYQRVEVLNRSIEGLILISATPEQLGIESHFSRLQLLDGDKFNDLDAFKQQETDYGEVAELLAKLVDGDDLDATEIEHVKSFTGLSDKELDDNQQTISALVDRHGTGRVLFRNTRKVIQGFPQRHVNIDRVDGEVDKNDWLLNFIEAHKEEKSLLICQSMDEAIRLSDLCFDRLGLRPALFHEGLSLIERDRAAAYFAEEFGSSILISSEIGSEGRNFQFCKNLVLFDLPNNPDMLEQRIGRLDRIGQKNDVNIFAPVIKGSEASHLIRWFDKVLNCMAQTNPAAGYVHNKYWNMVRDTEFRDPDILEMVRDTLADVQESIENGRDRILELSSCRQPQADAIATDIREFGDSDDLWTYMDYALDLLNVYVDEIDEDMHLIQPVQNMMVPGLPGLPQDGATFTTKRDIAMAREDVQLLSWDHPMVHAIFDLMTEGDIGVASICQFETAALPPATLLLDALITFDVQCDQKLQPYRFLPPEGIRVLTEESGTKNLDAILPADRLAEVIKSIDKKLGREVIQMKKAEITTMVGSVQSLAEEQAKARIDAAIEKAHSFFDNEIGRLEYLKQQNPLVKDEEITQLKDWHEQMIDILTNKVDVSVNALRVIVITPPEK